MCLQVSWMKMAMQKIGKTGTEQQLKLKISIVLSAFALTYIIIIPLDILIYIIDPILEDYFLNENYPIAENLYKMGFYIPSGIGISEYQIHKVSEALTEVFKK